MSARLSLRFRNRNASLLTEQLEPRVLLAADGSVVINELHTNPDVDTELVEFIELHNTSDSDVALGGWYFDDGVTYSFPDDAVLPAGGYHVITQNAEHFATKFGREANGQWVGRLSNDGETVTLRSDAGDLVDRVDFGLGFPWPTVGGEPGYSLELVNPQFDNQLGGNWRSSTGNQTIFTAGDSWEYFKGKEEPSIDPTAWRQTNFDDANWQAGSTPIGFGRSLVVATELDDMRREYSTVYLRKDFTIDNASSVESLTLDAIYDDGINVWINGTHVAGRNVDGAEIAHDGVANGRGNTRSFESIVLANASEYLVDGTNTIAVQLLNETLAGSDAYFDAALINNSLRAPGPTPGYENSIAAERLGPSLRQVDHSPTQPSSSEDVTIQIKATDPEGVASVTLEYQTVSPGNYIRISDGRFATDWTSVPMHDDGTNGDAVAGDSIYTTVISADAHQHRQLMRYRVRAEDNEGDSVVVPNADDPQPNFAYFVYDGIPGWTGADEPGSTDPVSFSADVMNQLPTYHLIADADDVQRSQYQAAFEEVRFRGTMVYGDQVYDHIEFRVRGEFSTYVAGKNKWKFFFNRGHEFQGHDNFGQPFASTRRVLNFSAATTPWMPMNRGMAGIGEATAYRLYDLAGIASPDTNYVQFRVIDGEAEATEDQYEGDLWGLYLALEQPDGRFLNERNLPDSTTFKMEGGAGQGDMKNQGSTQPDATRDLRTFMSAARRTNDEAFWRDNVDLDAYYTFRAINREINNMDIRDGWNHYLYHNAETNKYTVVPWDLDMLFIPTTHWSGVIRIENSLRIDAIDVEYKNRGRELQDLLFNSEQIGMLVDEIAGVVNPQTGDMTMVDVDQFMWNHNPRTSRDHRGAFNRQTAPYSSRGGNGNRTMISGDHEGFAQWIKDFMLPGPGGGSERAAYGWDFLTRESTDTDIPETPVISHISGSFAIDDLRFHVSDFADPQGAGTFGRIEWRVAEITDPTAPAFDPAAANIYEVEPVWESGELTVFSSETTVPSHTVEVGHTYRARVRVYDDSGRASHWSEPIQFTPTPGDTGELAGALRVSEVHYHPAEPSADEVAAGFTDKNDFEFIEIINKSNTAVDLSSVELVRVEIDGELQGVDFNFAEGSITQLAAGQHVVIAENVAAFTQRYGDTIPIAGEWSGKLSNSTETITLSAAGIQIQQFQYSDDWHPSTDGGGRSLEVPDTNVELDSWNMLRGWQPSSIIGGTPGRGPRVIGDVNGDGLFNSADLVQVFASAEYEDGIANNSTFETGDWNGDGDFTSSDFVFAFMSGRYVAAARPLKPQSVDLLFDRTEWQNEEPDLGKRLLSQDSRWAIDLT